MSVTIRVRRDDDLPALARVLAEQQAATRYPVRWPLPIPVEDFLVRPGEERAWVAEVDGRVVGHVAVHSPTGALREHYVAGAGTEDLAELAVLFVGTDVIGTGVGGRLHDTAVDWIVASRRRPVLDVLPVHERAVEVYRHLGWTVIGEVQPAWLAADFPTMVLMALPAPALTARRATRRQDIGARHEPWHTGAVTDEMPAYRPGRHVADDLGAVVADLVGTADRERIARDLHYLVVARLDAMRLLIERSRVEADPALVTEMLAEATRTIDQTKEEIREAVFGWRLADSSLVTEMLEVVETYASLMKFAPEVEVVGPVSQISEAIADSIVPVLREALSNIARHAAADAGEVELLVTGDEVRLTVQDDGVGASNRTTENGLRHARRRAETLGGSLELSQRQPRGTTFLWRVPLT